MKEFEDASAINILVS